MQSDQKIRLRSMRHKYWDYANGGWYFVTICTKDRACLLGDIDPQGLFRLSPIGEIVSEEWQKTPTIRTNVELDEWIIMPNHIHGILIVDSDNEDDRRKLTSGCLGAIVGRFKDVCTRRIRRDGFINFEWQRNYYDHIIRNERDLDRIRLYINNNPFKWVLDEDNPENW